MNSKNNFCSSSEVVSHPPLNPHQYHQVLEAILEGEYSWACILLLRFSGKDPLAYIPTRTYYRVLMKNKQLGSQLSLEEGTDAEQQK